MRPTTGPVRSYVNRMSARLRVYAINLWVIHVVLNPRPVTAYVYFANNLDGSRNHSPSHLRNYVQNVRFFQFLT